MAHAGRWGALLNFGVYLDGDEKPLALFRYEHHAVAWAMEHAGDVRRVGNDDGGDGLDAYRVR